MADGMEDSEPTFTKIAENIRGAEGPVFDADGQFYMVAPEVEKDGKFAGQVLKVDLSTGKLDILCEPSLDGEGGVPAGCQCDKNNDIWIADMRLGIIKVNKDGQFQQVCKTDKDNNPMQGCNDCSFDYSGNLWVTAPAGEIAPSPYRRSMEEPFGSVYCMTKDGEVIKVDTGIRFPNGIAVKHSEDGRPSLLIVAETPTKSLWGYNILGPGKVSEKFLWGKLPGNLEGGPDGMDFDVEGNLLVAHWGSSHIEVFSPEGGSPKIRIKCPFANPSNVHFQQKSNTVYVTEHEFHGLWKFEWKNKGMPQYCDIMTF
ncbi:diisopropyl-fluorophosphatase-like [Argopecten irradians]|uniref:diisopropyl-fluorophosphatase-like n=1 Tax=Argopecten irradians TaxID=31199 RepID=UPI00371181ED